MSDVRERMMGLLEAAEAGDDEGGEELEPKLIELAQHVALGADALGITDPKELAAQLKKIAMKPSVLKRAMRQMAQAGKAAKVAKSGMKAART